MPPKDGCRFKVRDKIIVEGDGHGEALTGSARSRGALKLSRAEEPVTAAQMPQLQRKQPPPVARHKLVGRIAGRIVDAVVDEGDAGAEARPAASAPPPRPEQRPGPEGSSARAKRGGPCA